MQDWMTKWWKDLLHIFFAIEDAFLDDNDYWLMQSVMRMHGEFP
jgi:hypothetical protein